jgi:hypothetical protein
MLARSREDEEKATFDTIGLHAVVLAEVESIVSAMRASGSADASFLEFLQSHVRRFIVALKVVRPDAEARPEYGAAKAILASIDEMLGSAAQAGSPGPDEELVRRFLEAEDAELLSLHLIQAQEETEALRAQVDGLRKAAGSALETSKGEEERVQRLLKERTAVLEKAGALEEDVRYLRRKLAETEERAARDDLKARESFAELDARRKETEADLETSKKEQEEIRTMLLATKGELATARSDSEESRSVVSLLSGELAEAKRLLEVPDRPPHPPSRAPAEDPTEPADRAPLLRRTLELEAKLEEAETAKAAISADLDEWKRRARRAEAETGELKKRAVAWQSRLPEIVREKAVALAEKDRRQLSSRISELGGRDSVLRSIEASHLVIRSPEGPVVVPRAVARNLGLAPGTSIRVQVDGGTVKFAKI